MTWTAELAGMVAGQVLLDDASREAVATDFGRLIVRKPAAVVRPASAEDVARRHQVRGGTLARRLDARRRALADRAVALRAHRARHDFAQHREQVDEKAATAICQAGMKWRSLVEQLAPQQLSPPVLTNNLDVTIGGTLSTGGLGVGLVAARHAGRQLPGTRSGHRDGEIVRCSADENRDLFDAVRAGMGQFGVITEAKLKLRRHQPKFRSFYLLYDDLNFLLEDLKTVMTDERFDYLESWCVPCAQGFRKAGPGRTPFAQWFFPLHATVETDGGNLPDTTQEARGPAALQTRPHRRRRHRRILRAA